ncbi:MAG: hypothetical protein IKT67_03085 [Lachnospiraceae bacterium]|nr:hypothetical protein [Lachnospiraceae bacterium]
MKKGSFALRLFLYASLVSLVWLGAYVIFSELFAVKETAPDKPQVQATKAPEVPIPVASQWSVLAVVNKEQEVSGFWFRYADFLADTMVFIEVPVNTKAELVKGGYEVLRVHNPESPELFMVSDLCRIFSEETRCMAAEEVGVSLLGLRPKECYIVEEALYNELTETVEGQRRFKKPESLLDTVTTIAGQALTDDTLREELVYLESYEDLKQIVYRTLPGEASAEEFHPDFGAIGQMVEALQNGWFEEE